MAKKPAGTPETPRRRNVNGSRYYEIDGKLYRSVTTILNVIAKPGLIPWATGVGAEAAGTLLRKYEGKKLSDETIRAVDNLIRNAHNETKEEAADLGTLAHEAIASHLEGNPLNVSDEIREVVEHFDRFLKREKLEPIIVEGVVYSDTHAIYAGTVDVAAMRLVKDGRKWKKHAVVVDWKRAKNIYPEYALQIAAYAKALEEKLGMPVEEGLVVRARKEEGKDLDYDELHLDKQALEDAWEAFQAAKALDDGLRKVRRHMQGKEP